MKKEHLDEVLAYFENERRVVTYFKDKYAVDVLKRFVGNGKSIAEIKRSQFAKLLNKPLIKAQLAQIGNGQLTNDWLDAWWRDEVFYFDRTLDIWQGGSWNQTTRSGYNLVVQLNFTQSHNRDYAQLENHFGVQNCNGHPARQGERETMAWARIDLSEDLSEALIEEVQTDWLRRASNGLKRSACTCQKDISDNTSQNENFARYFNTHIKPITPIWDEAILATALNFVFNDIGVERAYYHDFDTGVKLKNISYSYPPKSLYTKLPKRFGFQAQNELPQFLANERRARKTWQKMEKPTIYQTV